MFELERVSAGYGAHTVLRDVSLAVPDDAVVALLGPNGAGKTTMLRVASGLLPTSAGRLVLGGEDVTGSRPDELARLGVCHVPEGRGVFPGLSVSDNLRLQAPARADRAPAGPRPPGRVEARSGIRGCADARWSAYRDDGATYGPGRSGASTTKRRP